MRAKISKSVRKQKIYETQLKKRMDPRKQSKVRSCKVSWISESMLKLFQTYRKIYGSTVQQKDGSKKTIQRQQSNNLTNKTNNNPTIGLVPQRALGP